MSEQKVTKRPTHEIFVVQDGNGKSHWTKIGAAWANKDDKGMTLIFDALPVSGRAVIRVIKEKDQDATGNGGQQ